MKATGIVRRIDDLGRVVVPKEIRRNNGIKDGDAFQITVKLGNVYLRKLDENNPDDMNTPQSKAFVIRRIDDLGRVIIPRLMQKEVGVVQGDPMEIYTEDGCVVFVPYRVDAVEEEEKKVIEAVPLPKDFYNLSEIELVKLCRDIERGDRAMLVIEQVGQVLDYYFGRNNNEVDVRVFANESECWIQRMSTEVGE